MRGSRLKVWKTKPIFWLRMSASASRDSVRDVVAVQPVAPARRRVEAAQEVHEGRLAGAGRPHHRDELPGRDVEADAAQGVDLVLAQPVGLDEVADLDERRPPGSGRRSSRQRRSRGPLAGAGARGVAGRRADEHVLAGLDLAGHDLGVRAVRQARP